MTRSVKVTLDVDPAKFTTGLEPCKRSVEDFKGTLGKLDRAIRTLPDVKVHAETTDAELRLAAVKEELKDLHDRGATIDVHLAAAQVAKIRAELAALQSTSGVSLAVHQAAAQTESELARLAKVLPAVAAVAGERASGSLWDNLLGGASAGVQKLGEVIQSGAAGIPAKLKEMLAGLPWGAIIPVAAIVSFLAPAIAAGISTGMGLGGIAAGIALAAHDPKIVAAGKDLLATLTGQLQGAAQPFVRPVLQAVAILKAGFAHEMPAIQAMFARLATSVPGLARGVSGFLAGLTDGFVDATAKAKPLVDLFAQRLPQVGATLGNLFKEINFDATSSREGLNLFFNIVNNGIKILGVAIQALERVGQAMNWLIKTASSMATINQWKLDPAKGPGLLAKQLDSATDAANRLDPALNLTSDDIGKLQTKITQLTPSLATLAGAASGAVFNALMGVDQANLSVAKSLTSVSDALKQNGRQLDIHSAKGQANREAILGAVQANIQQYQAMIASGVGAEDAARAYDDNTAALERQLRKAGLTGQQIDGLIGKYRNVPDKVNTALAMQGLTDAVNGLNDLLRLINHLPPRKTIVVSTVYRSDWRSYRAGEHARGGVMLPAAEGMAYGAGIYPASNPPLIKFAEPQTGGETLIPNMGIPAQRGLALADYAASHYGGRVVSGGDLNLTVTVRDDTGRMLQVIRREVQGSYGGDVQLALGQA